MLCTVDKTIDIHRTISVCSAVKPAHCIFITKAKLPIKAVHNGRI